MSSLTQNIKDSINPVIVESILSICMRVHSKLPGAGIILMAVFPREQSPTHPRRILINEIYRHLEACAKVSKIEFVNIRS